MIDGGESRLACFASIDRKAGKPICICFTFLRNLIELRFNILLLNLYTLYYMPTLQFICPFAIASPTLQAFQPFSSSMRRCETKVAVIRNVNQCNWSLVCQSSVPASMEAPDVFIGATVETSAATASSGLGLAINLQNACYGDSTVHEDKAAKRGTIAV